MELTSEDRMMIYFALTVLADELKKADSPDADRHIREIYALKDKITEIYRDK
jgi:hypothetical protein